MARKGIGATRCCGFENVYNSIGNLLWRLLLMGELPFVVSLLHALYDCSGLLTDIEGMRPIQELKSSGEVENEPTLSRFIKHLKRARAIRIPLFLASRSSPSCRL